MLRIFKPCILDKEKKEHKCEFIVVYFTSQTVVNAPKQTTHLPASPLSLSIKALAAFCLPADRVLDFFDLTTCFFFFLAGGMLDTIDFVYGSPKVQRLSLVVKTNTDRFD